MLEERVIGGVVVLSLLSLLLVLELVCRDSYSELEACPVGEVGFRGACSTLASQGPCPPGSWLLLLGVQGEQVEVACTTRRCAEGEVWWSPTCSCLNPTTTPHPCGEGVEVLVSPRGAGLCGGCRKGWRKVGERCYMGAEVRGIFDELPVNEGNSYSQATPLNCYMDHMGRCRRGWGWGRTSRVQKRQVEAGEEKQEVDNQEEQEVGKEDGEKKRWLSWLQMFPADQCPL